MKFFFLMATIALAFALSACCGPRGRTGAPGVAGPKGDTGLPGADGADGRDGVDGTDGQDGATGPQGPQGPAGADGQIAQIVQLCPGTTTYPGVFVEVALLINGKLYGVYSANNGFLTYFPPGTYHSNAIGSSCNFRINADNTVTPL